MTRVKIADVGISRSIEIVPAVKSDVPAVLNAIVSAYQNDLIWFLARDYMDEVLDEFERAIAEAFDDRRARIWKAVDTRTDRLVGGAIWGRFDEWKPADIVSPVHLHFSSSTHAPSTAPEFVKRMADAISKQREKWILGKKCWLLGQLFVDSNHQRQGIGTMLLKKGLDEADREGTVAWLESTPAGHGLYTAYGFRDVGSFPIDLSEYGGKGFGWGVYDLGFMLRLPSRQCADEGERSICTSRFHLD